MNSQPFKRLPSEDPFAGVGEPAQMRRRASTPAPVPVPKPLAARSRKYPSGLIGFAGHSVDPAAAIDHFARFASLYFIWKPPIKTAAEAEADSDHDVFGKLETTNYLWDWCEPDIQQFLSPRLLSIQDNVPVAEVWGQDRLVCLYSRSAADAKSLLHQLTARDAADPETPPARLLFLAQPNTVRTMLRAVLPDSAGSLMPEIDGVLVEGEAPGAWECFCKPQFAGMIENSFARPSV